MRQIGTLSNQQDATRFRDYLLTRDISSQVDGQDGEWAVWVHDEDRLETAREELQAFLAAPHDGKYADAIHQAARKREQMLAEDLAARKRHVDMRQRWNRPVYTRLPVTMLLIAGSIVVTLRADFGKNKDFTEKLYIQQLVVTPDGRVDHTLSDVRSGEVWRLVSPIFLHLNMLHIFFNMYLLFMLGGAIEAVKGSLRFLMFVLLMAVLSNLAQFYWTSPLFGGMSGVDFGLFGYLWMKSRFAPEEGFFVPRSLVIQLVFWMVLCIFVIPNIANAAHVAGLAVGCVIALAPVVGRRLLA